MPRFACLLTLKKVKITPTNLNFLPPMKTIGLTI